jgi:hypothetical protein
MMSRSKFSVPWRSVVFYTALIVSIFVVPVKAQTNNGIEATAGVGIDPAERNVAVFTNQVITFDKAEITGRWVDSWEDKGVMFTPAHAPTKSKAKARLMFFPHAPSGRKGILSAMADDPIPVRASFTNGALSVTISFWGSTDCAARLEAYNREGQLVDKNGLEKIPGRKAPAEPIPTFDLTVRGTNIAYVEFSGPRPGEYLAAEEVKFVELPAATR